MFQLFGSVKSLIKPQSCVTDNQVFRLHYRVTMSMLVAASLMVTAHQYFGDPIDCMTKRNVPAQLLDTYCWIHSTYSIENSWQKEVGVDVPYPGVDNSVQDTDVHRVYHGYYQWVCFVLFFQALFFYLPHYIWKCTEDGLVKNLILGLDKPIVKQDDLDINLTLLTDYIERSRRMHRKLFIVYVVSELLNLTNVIVQMILMDRFLGGQFFNYGWEVIRFSEWAWPMAYDPMKRIFPRVTKCEFFQYGPSATIERFDTMCILPVNILTEKVYIFLWFWFYFLALISCLVLCLRLLVIIAPSTQIWLLNLRCRTLKQKVIRKILKKGNIGDWFLLQLLAKNLNTLNFHDLMLHLEDRIDEREEQQGKYMPAHHLEANLSRRLLEENNINNNNNKKNSNLNLHHAD